MSTSEYRVWATEHMTEAYLDVDTAGVVALHRASVRHRVDGDATSGRGAEAVARAGATDDDAISTEQSSSRVNYSQDLWALLRELVKTAHCTAGDDLERRKLSVHRV